MVARKKQDAQRKEGYNDFHVAKILSYINIYDERDITLIWYKFQATRSDWKGNRDHLKDRMLMWSTATGNAINMVPPGKVAIEDIISVECTPGGATGHYEFLERGSSPLLCHKFTVAKTREAHERDIANDASAGNHTLSEALSLGKGMHWHHPERTRLFKRWWQHFRPRTLCYGEISVVSTWRYWIL